MCLSLNNPLNDTFKMLTNNFMELSFTTRTPRTRLWTHEMTNRCSVLI